MIETVRRFIREEKGQGMAEYGLILALVSLVVVAALTLMGGELHDFFALVTGELGESVN